MWFVDRLKSDLVHAVRAFGRTPGFTAAAVGTLALGIGANAAMFSVVSAVLLAPLPYQEPERRVMIWSRWTGFDKTWLSEAEVADYRRFCPSLESVAAWSTGQANLVGDGDPLRVRVAEVTANAFDTLGTAPRLGRTFTDLEDRVGGEPVVVISDGLWRRRYAGDPEILGRTILVDGKSRRIVGVMPAGFRLPTDFGEDAAEPTELWTPLAMTGEQRGNHGLYAAAALRSGSSASAASAELRSLTRRLTQEGQYPAAMRFSAFAVPVADEILGTVRPALRLLQGAVAFLLLIACANVANLLLVRAETRQREIALRAALGAGRAHLLAQLLAEVLVLAVPGALFGLALAEAGLRIFAMTAAASIPRAEGVGLNGRVVLFTGAVALAAAVLFGLAPLFRSFRLRLSETLREAGPSATTSGRRQSLRSLLVVAEMGLCVVLLLGAGLMLRSLWALQHVDLGFAPEGVLTARLSLSPDGEPQPERTVAFYRHLLERVRALPGVRYAGVVRSLPLRSQIGDWGLDVDGFAESPGHNAKGDWQVVSDGAIEALGERVLRGRSFDARDVGESEQVGLVNETMARTYWPDRDALGGRFRMGSRETQPWVTVVGIVKDVRHNGVTAPIKEKFYRPHAQFYRSTGFTPSSMNLVLKATGDPMLLAGPLRAAVKEIDPNVPVSSLRLMTEIVAGSLATPRLASGLLGLFAVIALALSAVGIYGVLAYVVGQRTQEIGIRMAIGAEPAALRRLVLGQGLRMALTGVGLGTLVALGLTRLLNGLLHDVRPHDPLTFILVPLALTAIALLACYVPARRATRVDPIAALRSE
jgi:putative ABC transport system permease protein